MSNEPMLAPGSVVAGRFRCTRAIARGGMGAVYAAVDERLGREVAIKVLRGELAEDRTIVARFEREALAAARLTHPGIAQVHDFGVTPEGLCYLVMELVPGETLGALLAREGKLAPARAADLVEQALGALATAHAAGIVHRDLKPGNLMVVPTGASREAVKVLDFGIAQVVASEAYTRLTRTGVILGTPSYMAPEQALGGAIDARTDVYAMGVLLWCMLTGRKPYTGADMAAIVEQLLSTTPPRADAIEASVPSELAGIAETAMQKEPGRRFQDATAMANALVAFRTGPSRAATGVVGPAPSASVARTSLLDLTAVPREPTAAASWPLHESPPLASPPSPSPGPTSRWGRARRALASPRARLGLGVGLLAGAVLGCVVMAGAAAVPAYWAASRWQLVPAQAAPAGVATQPAPGNGSPGRPAGVPPPTWQPAPVSASAVAECTRAARCCEAFSRRFGSDASACPMYQQYGGTIGAARCQQALDTWAGPLRQLGGDASACE